MEIYVRKHFSDKEDEGKTLKEQVNNEKVADFLTTLKDENFGNEDQRKKMVDIMSSLMNIKDPDARRIFKRVGQFFTKLGDEMLGGNREEPEMELPEEEIIEPNIEKKTTIEEYI